jgi:hypothetical protein
MFAAVLFVCIPNWCGFITPETNTYSKEVDCVAAVKSLAVDIKKQAPDASLVPTCLKVKAETI